MGTSEVETVHYSLVCDRIQHCSDASDENWCEFESCDGDAFVCLNKQCVHQDKRCDEVPDCADASDETV